MDTILRLLETLRLLPRAPRKITAEEICRRLADRGYEVSKRTVERDLDKLSGAFPLVKDDRSKPYGWQWAHGAELLDLPTMDQPTALTFHFVHQYLEPLLPVSVRAFLQPHLDIARKVLDENSDGHLPRWSERVLVIPQGQALKAPTVDEAVMETVYEAVLRERRLRLRYRPQKTGGKPKDYEASPLGIVWRNQVCYIVATLFDFADVVQLALHRVDQAELLDQPVNPPKGFSLREYVSDGAFAYPVGSVIKLIARFDRAAAFHLAETPLSADQKLEPVGESHMRLTATVQDTQQLRWWLLSFGAKVEVEAPKALRTEFAKTAAQLHKRYK